MECNMQTILVTDNAGYITSHTYVKLLERDYNVTVVDNLRNSNKEPLNRVKQITGISATFYELDLLDKHAPDQVFAQNSIDATIHFEELKAVGKYTQIPLAYFHNDLTGTLMLLEAMQQANVFNLVFSSSATFYSAPPIPYIKHFPLSPTSPYKHTKVMIEQVLQDAHYADSRWNVSLSRYFNPIGTHSSGLIGEDPNGIPNNLMPFITQVAEGKRANLSVFGTDYPTSGGTGVCDYIHAVDLEALEKLEQQAPSLADAYNQGTGKGFSLLKGTKVFEKTSGKTIAYEIPDAVQETLQSFMLTLLVKQGQIKNAKLLLA